MKTRWIIGIFVGAAVFHAFIIDLAVFVPNSTGSTTTEPPQILRDFLTRQGRVGQSLEFKIDQISKSAIPSWMKKYLEWHAKNIASIQQDPSVVSNQTYLLMTCTDADRCGGTSDRLKAFPFFMYLGYKCNRIVLIRWTRPFRIEEFIVPGPLMNWTVPDAVEDYVVSSSNTSRRVYYDGLRADKLIRKAMDPSIQIMEGNLYWSGEDLYEKMVLQDSANDPHLDKNDADYQSFYHDVFHGVFQPSPPIERIIKVVMRDLNLIDNQFVSAHYRAKYPGEPFRKTGDTKILAEFSVNAVKCASSLAPGLPVYFASDTLRALEAVKEWRNESIGINALSHLNVDRRIHGKIMSALPEEDPRHLNFAKSSSPSGFFSIFVDLFIMSHARCTAYGAGGFGQFGSLASHNVSCHIAHSNDGKMQVCTS